MIQDTLSLKINFVCFSDLMSNKIDDIDDEAFVDLNNLEDMWVDLKV